MSPRPQPPFRTQERRAATDAEAKALASPMRLRILRACLGEAHTNKEIAGALVKDPATTLHHVRTLVDTGFLEALEPRRGLRGSREIPYRATGKSWFIESPGTFGYLLDTFIEEVALVPAETVHASRLGLRMTPQLRAAFEQRLDDLLEEFRTLTDAAEDGEPWSVFFALHPDPNRPTETD
ncbi:MAG: ArsR/SmtB family transcription factor [Jatrophihabitans sp.]